MKRLLHIALTLLLALVITSTKPSPVLADGEGDEHTLEMEVNGIHVALANQNEWKKGENTIIVTLKDSAGSPISDAEVEILLGPKSDDHAAAEADHSAPEAESVHGQEHASMPGMDGAEPAGETHDLPAHDEAASSLSLHELGDHGIYVADAYLDSAGTHEISVMFHTKGEMHQADFVVEIPGVISKTMVLWSFAVLNMVLLVSAGIIKTRSTSAKGQQ